MACTRLAKLGTRRGSRVPRPSLDAAGIQDAVTVEAPEEEIVLRRDTGPRANWAEAFKLMAARDAAAAEALMDFPNRFDVEEP